MAFQLPRDRALDLLQECTGDTIWPVDYARARRVPEAWIEQFRDSFESGFQSDTQTIYTEDSVTNQFHGIRDVDLVRAIAIDFGMSIEQYESVSLSRRDFVNRIRTAIEEGDDA